LIDDYFQSRLKIVAELPRVHSSNFSLEKRGEHIGLMRGDIYFADNSRLHIRELVNLRSAPPRVMYAYHYQRADRSLIFRYDNTRHHPKLPNFPHHKHTTSDTVSVFTPPDLETVLQEIVRLID
jgi:hypothetical protein